MVAMTRLGMVAVFGGAALARQDDEVPLLSMNLRLKDLEVGALQDEVAQAVHPSWTTLYASGGYGSTRLGIDDFNEAFRQGYHKSGVSIVRRRCTDCANDLKEVYFRRKTNVDQWDAHDGLLVTWRGDLGFHTDFDIYPTLHDALNDENAFQFCNGNDPGIGFPRDCGPRGFIGWQWTSLTRGGRVHHYDYAVYTEYKVEHGWTTLTARGSYGFVDRGSQGFNEEFRQGYYKSGVSIVRRKCEDCANDLKEVYFKRKTDIDSWDAHDGLLVTWRGDVGFHADFDIYPTLIDALQDRNEFQFCNGNDPGIGFPRDCGPVRYIAHQWTSLTRGGREHYEYAVYTVKDDCDERLHGYRESGYRGCQDTTVGGKKCQKWTAQSPHRHSRTPENYPGKGLGDHNYCRNPDEDANLWCYTTDSSERWDYCAPKHYVCDETFEGDGSSYRGCQDTSRTGKTCQEWTAQSPHAHTRTLSNYPNKGLGFHNYCRNPDGDSNLWCYTLSETATTALAGHGTHRWDYCDPIGERELKWVGCYVDDGNRDMENGPKKYGYTVETCDAACTGFNLFALQNNGWCVCSNKVNTDVQYEKRPDSDCGSPCDFETADVSPRHCGAAWRNAVYMVSRLPPAPGADDVKWVGCYVDDGQRDLENGPKEYGYTIDTCHTACAGFKYFALQNGGWCVCGNEVGHAAQYTKQPDSECGGFCSDETADVYPKFCGASWRNAVYSVTIPAPAPGADDVKWVGCYVDDGQRDLEDGPKEYGYTIATCDTKCSGFKYFALQNNGWCVCGNEVGSAAQYTKQPDSECGGFCKDETAAVHPKFCGGPWRNAVYEVTRWEPKLCCKALTAECLACAVDMSAAEYCAQHPGTVGCKPDEPETPVCCRAHTPECLSCQAGLTKEDYCSKYPHVEGCQVHIHPHVGCDEDEPQPATTTVPPRPPMPVPPTNCPDPVEPYTCHFWGDPHFTHTFSEDKPDPKKGGRSRGTGKTFNFNPTGIFELAESADGSFQAQAFFCPAYGGTTTGVGVAMRFGDDVLQIVRGLETAPQSDDLVPNGEYWSVLTGSEQDFTEFFVNGQKKSWSELGDALGTRGKDVRGNGGISTRSAFMQQMKTDHESDVTFLPVCAGDGQHNLVEVGTTWFDKNAGWFKNQFSGGPVYEQAVTIRSSNPGNSGLCSANKAEIQDGEKFRADAKKNLFSTKQMKDLCGMCRLDMEDGVCGAPGHDVSAEEVCASTGGDHDAAKAACSQEFEEGSDWFSTCVMETCASGPGAVAIARIEEHLQAEW